MTLRIELDGTTAYGFGLRVDAALPVGQCTGIFGPSGSGKSTLLNCVAGLERVAGRVKWGDTVWQDRRVFVPAHRRRAAMVFQTTSVLTHLSVRENLEFAARYGAPGARRKVESVAHDFGIAEWMDRAADGLSGGEQQRVALARAVVAQPPVLLLDEPLTGLDDEATDQMLQLLMQLRQSGQTMLFVSHSAYEQALVADHLLTMASGRMTGCDTAARVFERSPANSPLGKAFGVVIHNLRVLDHEDGLAVVRFGESTLRLAASSETGQSLSIRIRADDVSLTTTPNATSSIMNSAPATVSRIRDEADSPFIVVHLALGGTEVLSRITRPAAQRLNLEVGQAIYAQIKAAALSVFEKRVTHDAY